MSDYDSDSDSSPSTVNQRTCYICSREPGLKDKGPGFSWPGFSSDFSACPSHAQRAIDHVAASSNGKLTLMNDLAWRFVEQRSGDSESGANTFESLKQKFEDLDKAYRKAIISGTEKEVIFAGEALTKFGKTYNLDHWIKAYKKEVSCEKTEVSMLKSLIPAVEDGETGKASSEQ